MKLPSILLCMIDPEVSPGTVNDTKGMQFQLCSCVSPMLTDADIKTLTGFLASHIGGMESDRLKPFVNHNIGAPLSTPYEEGYELAQQLLEDLALPNSDSYVDIRRLLRDLGIYITEERLGTGSVRGVAVAGSNFQPGILINLASSFNSTDEAGASRRPMNCSIFSTIVPVPGGLLTPAVHGHLKAWKSGLMRLPP
jgi:hypothetical protein